MSISSACQPDSTAENRIVSTYKDPLLLASRCNIEREEALSALRKRNTLRNDGNCALTSAAGVDRNVSRSGNMHSSEKHRRSVMITRSSKTFMRRGCSGPTGSLTTKNNPVKVNKPKTAEFCYFKEAMVRQENQHIGTPNIGATSRTENLQHVADPLMNQKNKQISEVDKDAENSFKLLKVSEEKSTELEEDVEGSGTAVSSKRENDFSTDYQGVFDRLRKKLQLLATESLTEEEKDPADCRITLVDILLSRLDCDPKRIKPATSKADGLSVETSHCCKKVDALGASRKVTGARFLDIRTKMERSTRIKKSRDVSLEDDWELESHSQPPSNASFQLSSPLLSSDGELRKSLWESSEEGATVCVDLANSFDTREDDLELFPECSITWPSKDRLEAKQAFRGDLGNVAKWYSPYPDTESYREEDITTFSSDYIPYSDLKYDNGPERLYERKKRNCHLNWDSRASTPSLEQDNGFDVCEHLDRGWRGKKETWDSLESPTNSTDIADYDCDPKAFPLANILDKADEMEHMLSQDNLQFGSPFLSPSSKENDFDFSFPYDTRNQKPIFSRGTDIFQQVTPCQEFCSPFEKSSKKSPTPASDFSPSVRRTALPKLEGFHSPQLWLTNATIESPSDTFFLQHQIRMHETTDNVADSFKVSRRTFQSNLFASFSDSINASPCWDGDM